eukprot:7385725-Prymnesium_polylepis.1
MGSAWRTNAGCGRAPRDRRCSKGRGAPRLSVYVGTHLADKSLSLTAGPTRWRARRRPAPGVGVLFGRQQCDTDAADDLSAIVVNPDEVALIVDQVVEPEGRHRLGDRFCRMVGHRACRVGWYLLAGRSATAHIWMGAMQVLGPMGAYVMRYANWSLEPGSARSDEGTSMRLGHCCHRDPVATPWREAVELLQSWRSLARWRPHACAVGEECKDVRLVERNDGMQRQGQVGLRRDRAAHGRRKAAKGGDGRCVSPSSGVCQPPRERVVEEREHDAHLVFGHQAEDLHIACPDLFEQHALNKFLVAFPCGWSADQAPPVDAHPEHFDARTSRELDVLLRVGPEACSFAGAGRIVPRRDAARGRK